MRGFALAVLAVTAAGCGSDCLKTSTVQVKLMVNRDINQALFDQLVVEMIDVGTGAVATKNVALDGVADLDGQTFLINPSPVPSTSYELYVHVVAASKEGTFLATGFDDEIVSPNGCNRLTVKLDATGLSDPDMGAGGGGGSIGGNVDMSGLPPSTDMASPPPPDMAGCIGGMPDEDHDLHADSCDACPADPETVFTADGDNDGLHDACDPDPGKPGNTLVFNELFGSDIGHWALDLNGGSGVSINTSRLEMQSSQSSCRSSQQLVAGDKVDLIPNGVRVQTWYNANMGGLQFCNAQQTVGLILGSSPSLAVDGSSGSGVICSVNNNLAGQNVATLDIARLNGANGQIVDEEKLNGFPMKTMVRLRLTQRGNSYVCEMVTLGSDMITTSPPVTVMLNTQAPPDGAQYVSVVEENISDTQFDSVVAETALPNP